MSGRKNILSPYLLVDAVAMDGDITSAATNIQYLDNISIQFVWTGTPTGVLQIEGSLDQDTWVPLVLSTAIEPAGADDTALADLNQLSFPYIRVFYDRTSGDGFLTVKISGKQV